MKLYVLYTCNLCYKKIIFLFLTAGSQLLWAIYMLPPILPCLVIHREPLADFYHWIRPQLMLFAVMLFFVSKNDWNLLFSLFTLPLTFLKFEKRVSGIEGNRRWHLNYFLDLGWLSSQATVKIIRTKGETPIKSGIHRLMDKYQNFFTLGSSLNSWLTDTKLPYNSFRWFYRFLLVFIGRFRKTIF